jgi:phosphonatase-like hydrolase
MVPELLVSDLAGTVMRDEGSTLRAYRTTLSELAIPFTEADLTARRGASKAAVLRELAARQYPESEVAAIARKALARFDVAVRADLETCDVREIEGAGAAYRRLKQAGIKIAITSGHERGVLDLLVRRLGWEDLFDCVTGGDEVPLGRPAPFLIYRAMMALGVGDVGRVAVVGDTALDLRAGTNARAGWVIGVLGGAHPLETLGASPHTHLLPSVASLPALFDVG